MCGGGGGVDGRSPCRMSIIIDVDVALSVLRKPHVAMSILRKCHMSLVTIFFTPSPLLHVAKA